MYCFCLIRVSQGGIRIRESASANMAGVLMVLMQICIRNLIATCRSASSLQDRQSNKLLQFLPKSWTRPFPVIRNFLRLELLMCKTMHTTLEPQTISVPMMLRVTSCAVPLYIIVTSACPDVFLLTRRSFFDFVGLVL